MITTYDQLIAQIASYTHRTDLGPQFSTFVQLCEQRINQFLEVQELEVVLESNPATSPVDLADDWQKMIQVTANGFEVPVITSAAAARYYRADSPGTSCNYVIEGRTLRLLPFTAGMTLRQFYRAKVEAITADQQTNIILRNYPSLYLYGSLMEAFAYMQDIEAGRAVTDLWSRDLDAANLASENARYGDGVAMTAL